MGFFSSLIDLFGRVFIAALFITSGIEKILNFDSTIIYMEKFNIPIILTIPAIVVELLLPLLIIFGYKTRLSAFILALFTISLAVIFHSDFTNQMQIMSFLKNFAIAGGFLIIFVRGSGKYSIDHKLN